MESLLVEQIDDLEELLAKCNEYSAYLESVEVMTDNKLFRYYQKQVNEILPITQKYSNFKENQENIEIAQKLITDGSAEDENFLKNEINDLTDKNNKLVTELKILLFDYKNFKDENIQIELATKSGSNEFIKLIESVLQNYSNRVGFILKEEMSTLNSLTLLVEGKGAYKKLKELSGIAKQILCKKEESVSIVVLNLEKQVDIIDESDFEIQTLKSGGAGGQHINKTESAIRIVHRPTGISVKCEDERSQTQNKEKAKELIIQKIMQRNKEIQENSIEIQRKNQINAIFSDTPNLIFDYDKNKFFMKQKKVSVNLKEALEGNLPI